MGSLGFCCLIQKFQPPPRKTEVESVGGNISKKKETRHELHIALPPHICKW
ncbi:MAG: hypothetical protein ACJAW3_000463 [Lentimonas sp.]